MTKTEKQTNELNAVCKFCGKSYHVKPSHLRWTRYCSKECHDKAQRVGAETQCFGCGKRFYLSPSLIRERNFCSNNCRLEWLSTYVKENLNVSGHSAGHKAPHLTTLNIERNPKIALEADKNKRGQYSKHRKIMEEYLGRKLEPWEDVHHINVIHDDNRIENLQVLPHTEHMKLHWQLARERGVI